MPSVTSQGLSLQGIFGHDEICLIFREGLSPYRDAMRLEAAKQ